MSTTATRQRATSDGRVVFISHISEERAVAKGLKKAITQDFLNLLTVFSSDDGESVAAGEDWLKSIDEALRKASILITLCSPASKYRPWIHFRGRRRLDAEIATHPIAMLA